MKRKLVLVAALATLAVPALAQQAEVTRGRYVAIIGGCNDCHTQDYPQKGGQVPESEWLLGGQVGFRGPWGTTYATNLRLRLNEMSETQWVAFAKKLQTRPPMPWFNLNKMADGDLRAFYRYAKSLSPAGKPAPAFVPPSAEPKTPFIVFVPQPPKK